MSESAKPVTTRVHTASPSTPQFVEMLQASPCATALSDAAGTLRWGNRAFWALLQRDEAEAEAEMPLPALPVLLGLSAPHRQRLFEMLAAQADTAASEIRLVIGGYPAVHAAQVAVLSDGARMLSLVPSPPPAGARAARLAELLDMSQEFGPFGVWERDLRTLDGRWDRHMYRFWGLAEGERTPAFDEAVQAVVEEDLPALDRAFRESTQRSGEYLHRYRLRSQDGSIRHMRSQWCVLNDADGKPERAIGIVVDETETWALARSYTDAHEQLSLVMDMAAIASWRNELAAARVTVSGQLGKLLGFGPAGQPIATERVLDLMHPEDHARNDEAMRAALQSEQPVDCELRFRHADGGWRHLLTRRVLQRDAAGQPLAVIGVALDISARVEAERLRTETMRQFELSASAARIGHWSLSAETGKASWSAQTYALHQLDPKEAAPLMPQWLARFVHPQDQRAVRARFLGSIARREPNLEQDFRIVRGDGSVRHVICHSRLSVVAAGVDLYGVVIDVTEQRHAEAALREANERVALAARSAGVATWEIDPADGRMVWDEQMWLLRGLPPRDRVPSREERVAMLHPQDRPLVAAELDQALDEGRPSAVEFRVQWPDGSWHWLASRSVPMHDERGREMRRIGINWDITDTREAFQARQERILAQRESQAKSQFLSRMSHELRTPLNAVLGFTQLLIADGERIAATTRAQRLMQIETAGQHLLSLINDVLDLSSLEGCEMRVVTLPVDLHAALAETLPLVEEAARLRQVSLRCGALPQRALADPTRLRQVLLNLLSNAVKYNREGGYVQVDGDGDGEEVRLRVRDSGRGIEVANLGRLFDPFDRLGAERDGIEGTGIGLTIVKALVERMGGSLAVQSTPGVGSTFEVRLRAVAGSHGVAGAAGGH